MLATRRPTGRQALGATPGRASLFPVAAPAPGLSSSPQQQLLDQRYIQRMFADGALGGLWLPEPQYLYEDSAGTLPASKEGVCGLWLNDGVSDAFGNDINTPKNLWSVQTGVSNEGDGSYVFSNASNTSAYRAFTALLPGVLVNIRLAITNYSSGQLRIGVRNTRVIIYGNGLYNVYLFSGGSTDSNVYLEGVSSFNGTVSDVYIRFSARSNGTQATLANKPTLRRTPVSGKYWLDSNNINATGAMTATFPSSLGSACTVARANADGVTITPAQTITTTYNLTPPFSYNSAVLVINRALTASETAVVSRYLRNWVPVLGNESLINTGFSDLNGWTKLYSGAGDGSDITASNGSLIVNSAYAVNTGVSTELQGVASDACLYIVLPLSSRNPAAESPTYIRIATTYTNKFDTSGTDIVPVNTVKSSLYKITVKKPDGNFFKMFTASFAGHSFTLTSPSVRPIL